MVDFHSHFLPHIDDGSKSVSESVQMLEKSYNDGVKTIVATPHFNGEIENPESFLKRRDKAFKSLEPFLEDNFPKIYFGAEIQYFDGIANSEDILKLKIQNTSLMLIEMPEAKWTQKMINDLILLRHEKSVIPIIAHIERCCFYQDVKTFDLLIKNGVLMQANANFFLKFFTERKAFHLLRDGYIQLLGSDCHNMADRPPNLRNAIDKIEKKYGNLFVREFCEKGERLFLNE